MITLPQQPGEILVFDFINNRAYQTTDTTLRGRVIRAFFWLMRFWPKP